MDYVKRIFSAEFQNVPIFVMAIEDNPMDCAKLMKEYPEKNVQIINLPDPSSCSAGDVVEVVRVALGNIDIATNTPADLITVCGLFDVVMANKSLPANLSALPCSKGRKVAYILDVRDHDARAALLRRDFIRSLGPVILFQAIPGEDIKSYFKRLDVACPQMFTVRSSEDDPWTAYDEAALKTKAPLAYIESAIDSFLLSSTLDAVAPLSKDFYALISISHDIRRQSAKLLISEESVSKTSSQILTRCGLHSNVQRMMLQGCARSSLSQIDFVTDLLQKNLKMKKYISP